MKTCAVSMFTTTILLAAVCAAQVDKEPTSPPSDLVTTLESRLKSQVAAWNQGDIDRFMTVYWHSPKLSFSSGGKTTYGWEQTRDGYKLRYPSREKMGRLSFSQLQVTPLGPQSAMVLGRWKLDRKNDEPNGNFSLVFRRLDGQWVIVHDHTSRTPEPDEKSNSGLDVTCFDS